MNTYLGKRLTHEQLKSQFSEQPDWGLKETMDNVKIEYVAYLANDRQTYRVSLQIPCGEALVSTIEKWKVIFFLKKTIVKSIIQNKCVNP